MSDLSTRVDVAVRGIRSLNVPVTRTSGAGPSDDGHVLIGGIGGAIPIRSDSPYEVSGNRLLLNGTDMGVEIEPVRRPRFYDLDTADGISYEKIARLHGTNVLATTVVQTCIRYDPAQRCRFCSIEASLQSGSTIAVKKPEQLAEVAEAAVRLDGVTQMIMTTGTSAAKDRGARHLARCVAAVKVVAPDLAIQVQCEPPGDLGTITDLRDAGGPIPSASTWSPWTTRFGGAGCPARRLFRWTSTGRRGARRFGFSDGIRCRPTCWSGWVKIPTNWSRAQPN